MNYFNQLNNDIDQDSQNSEPYSLNFNKDYGSQASSDKDRDDEESVAGQQEYREYSQQ